MNESSIAKEAASDNFKEDGDLQLRSSNATELDGEVPESEKVEWLNKTLKILWPLIQPIAVTIITKLIDLKLSKLDLGQHVSFSSFLNEKTTNFFIPAFTSHRHSNYGTNNRQNSTRS